MKVKIKQLMMISILFAFILLITFCKPLGNDSGDSGSLDDSGMEEELPDDIVYEDAGIFVSTTGSNDNGDGSIGNPYQTIQYVLDNVAMQGDTIILRGGTYPEKIRIREPNITIRSKSDEWAIIQIPYDVDGEDICVYFDVDSSYSKLQRVEVIGGYYYGLKFETKWDWGDPDDRTGASHIEIRDCIIHDTGRDCIKITPNCDYITITNCEIYNSGMRYDGNAEGIDCVNGDWILIQDCYIHDIATNGIYFKGGSMNCILQRTKIHNTGGAGAMTGFDTSPEYFDLDVNPDYYESIDCVIRNCIISETEHGGISLYASKNSRIYNNTIINSAKTYHSPIYFGLTFQDWDPDAGRPSNINPTIINNLVKQSSYITNPIIDIRYSDELGGMSALSGEPVMDNNLYYHEGQPCLFEDNRPGNEFSGNLSLWKTHISGDSNSIETDPHIDSDHHLLDSSPCIDAGQDVALVSYDIEQDERINTYDIGADEY